MNRLAQLLPSLSHPVASLPAVETRRALRVDRQHDCSVFVPLHYEANYAYPLMVWLNGPGESERQLKQIMPQISMRNYVAVAPRGIFVEAAGQKSTDGWAWPELAKCATEIDARIRSAICTARRKANIANARIFLAGYGSGGTAALRAALRNPTTFAGAISLCGGFPQGGNPLAQLDRIRRLPLLLACGQQGQSYAMNTVCDDLRLLHSAGMSVSLRVYPSGDEISPYMLPDMDRWMMEQMSATQAIIQG